MTKEINSKRIGVLTQDESFDDWWISEEIEIPFFDNEKLTITFMDVDPEQDLEFTEEADRALTTFLALTNKDRLDISDQVYKNCTEFMDMVGPEEFDEALQKMGDPKGIWNFVYPSEIYVSRRTRRDKDIYIQIACNCEWEEEHGLQLVFRQGKKLTRVSDQDGHLTEADAYDKLDSEDELLSQFDK